MGRTHDEGLLSRDELMAELGELLEHRDMLLTKIQIVNFPEIQSQHGEYQAERVAETIGELLTQVPNSLAVAKVTPQLFGTISTATEEPNHFLDEISHAVANLNREKAFPFIVELAVGGVVAQHGSLRQVPVWFERADFALQISRRMGRPQLYFEATAVQIAVKEILSRLSADSEPPEGMHWVYQPVNRIADGKVVGHESLCRWNIPGIGPTSPDLFIQAAEDLGLVHLIDIWGLKNLEKYQDAIAATGAKSVGFNLSARTLESDSSVLEQVRQLLAHNQKLGFQIVVEMTETAIAEDHTRLIALLTELRSSGIQIAIDDFGAGHTNLSSIAGLPCDYLKVDGSILRFADPKLVTGLLELAARMAELLGAGLVVEGVETPEQLAVAEAAGATHVQGWLFGKPLDPVSQP